MVVLRCVCRSEEFDVEGIFQRHLLKFEPVVGQVTTSNDDGYERVKRWSFGCPRPGSYKKLSTFDTLLAWGLAGCNPSLMDRVASFPVKTFRARLPLETGV